MKKLAIVMAVMLVVLGATARRAVAWTTIFSEDFNSNPAGWSYQGVQNAGSQDLERWNGGGYLNAEWDQSNDIADPVMMVDGNGDPVVDPWGFVVYYCPTMTNSCYSKPLGQTLTDADSFRFGAKLKLTSLAETTELYQIANFGLYDLNNTGPDRTWSSGGTLDQAKDFVEFNYFICTSWLGRNIQPTICSDDGTLVAGTSSDPNWPATHMGTDGLPLNTDLYVEVTYYASLRRAYAAVYTDPERTVLLNVGGEDVEYWTNALPADKSFSLTDVAFYNYVAMNWGGANGAGAGEFDDFYVHVPEPFCGSMLLAGSAALIFRRRVRRRG